MLLQHFTWQHFLVAVTILTAVWYVAVILIFYRQQLHDFLSGKRKPATAPEPLRHSWQDDYEDEPDEEDNSLIGQSVLPEGMTKVSMSMFGFAPKVDGQLTEPELKAKETDDAGIGLHESREIQQRLVPDAIEELKSIFYILERDNGDKEHFVSLFALVKNKYAAMRDTPSQRALNEYIRQNASFAVSDEELNNLWK